jgi:hypothetical protein
MTDTIPYLVDYHITKPGIPLPPIKASLYEYVMAGNGIFIRGARREFQSQFCITPCTIRGLANLEPSLELNAPHIPREMVEDMLRRARQARDEQGRPCEIVFHLELNETRMWQCHVPDQKQSPMRSKPNDDSPTSSYARACIELHSHVDMHASFSSMDDQDEQGFRIYTVLGCISTRPVIRVRVGMYGYRHDIPAKRVFDLPPGIADAVTGEGTLLGIPTAT